MSLALRQFLPDRETPEGWAAYHQFARAASLERRPGDPAAPDAVVEFDLRREEPDAIRTYFVAEESGVVIGLLRLESSRPGSPEYPSSRHLLHVHGRVDPPQRRRGLARSWLPHIATAMDDIGATTWGTYAELESGIGFLEAIGARRVFSGHENRLDLAALDWALMEEWSRIDSGFRLELHEPRLPQILFEKFSSAYTALARAVPMEDADHGEWITTPESLRDTYARFDSEGSSHHLLLAYDGEEIVGVTEYIRRPYQPGLIFQDLTAVAPSAQGRGLGKQLKAVLLIHMRQLFPELRTVVTENAGSNAPMLSINRRMGFRQYVAGAIYQMTRQELGRLL